MLKSRANFNFDEPKTEPPKPIRVEEGPIGAEIARLLSDLNTQYQNDYLQAAITLLQKPASSLDATSRKLDNLTIKRRIERNTDTFIDTLVNEISYEALGELSKKAAIAHKAREGEGLENVFNDKLAELVKTMEPLMKLLGKEAAQAHFNDAKQQLRDKVFGTVVPESAKYDWPGYARRDDNTKDAKPVTLVCVIHGRRFYHHADPDRANAMALNKAFRYARMVLGQTAKDWTPGPQDPKWYMSQRQSSYLSPSGSMSALNAQIIQEAKDKGFDIA